MVDEQQYFEDDGLDLSVLLHALWLRRVFIVLSTIAIFAVGTVVIFMLPTTYRSTATILLEEPEVPKQLVQTTVTTFAAQQIQYVNQRVMTRTNLANIIEKFDLYKDKRKYTPTLLLTNKARSNMSMDLISVEMATASGAAVLKAIAFTVGFRDEDPTTAQKVTNEVVSLYMEENVRSRTIQTAETSKFLTEEVDRLDQRVKELEQRAARFKEENDDSLPEMAQVNLGNIQRIDGQLAEISRRISSLDSTRIIIDSQLAQIEPTLPSILPDGSMVMSPTDQLKALQTRLAMLRGMYSEEHPDIVRARREIEALKAATGLTADLTESTSLLNDARTELAKAEETYGEGHPEVMRLQRLVDSLVDSVKTQRDSFDALIEPDNPAYIQLSAQKDTIDAEERSLREQQEELRAQLAEYEQKMLNAPRVEQELTAILRELQSATGQYYAMRERQFAAEMGESLEAQSKGERFVLVEPPNMPLEPDSPNRPAMMILLMVLAPSAGVGFVILRQMMDKSIWGLKMLDSVQGAGAIAEIPLIVTQTEKRHARLVRIFTLAGAPIAVLTVALTIHYVIRPLDVLWFVMLRKLGM